jgi:hypothetical protein
MEKGVVESPPRGAEKDLPFLLSPKGRRKEKVRSQEGEG